MRKHTCAMNKKRKNLLVWIFCWGFRFCCPSLMLQFVGRDVSGTLLDFAFIWIILSAQWCNKSDRHSWYSSHPHWVVSCKCFTSTRIEMHPWIIIGFEHHAVAYKNIEMSYVAYFATLYWSLDFDIFRKVRKHANPYIPFCMKLKKEPPQLPPPGSSQVIPKRPGLAASEIGV